MTRDALIALVTRIVNADGSEEDLDRMIEQFEASVLDPAASALIFHPDREMTPEEIVDRALGYKPIEA